jgi:serine/threonine protein kinase
MRFSAQIPKVLGGYRLIRQLGRGGMAEVWLAYKEEDPLEKPWVVKVLLPEFASSAKHQQRFRAEVKTLASLRHGRIVPIHECGTDQGFLFLVMEYIDGVNLRVFVNALAAHGETIPIVGVFFILGEVTDALRHAHDRTRAGAPRGVIHRDVTPTNVLVSSEGEVFLTDFGLARYEQEFSFEMFGTAAYIAPEQARGAACPQSDIFGLGGLVHFMLTGEPPRKVTNTMEIERVLDDPPPPTGRDDVPEALERIRLMCLDPSLARRFESAADLLAMIEKYPGYQRCATMLKNYHLRYFGPPRTGTTEALAMAKSAGLVESTLKITPPRRSKPEDPSDTEVTTFWQPSATPSRPPVPERTLPDVPPEYRPAPGGMVDADAPKIRRRPRRDAAAVDQPPQLEATEILPPPFAAEDRPKTERTTHPKPDESAASLAHEPESSPAAAQGKPRPRARPFGLLGLLLVGVATSTWALPLLGLQPTSKERVEGREDAEPTVEETSVDKHPIEGERTTLGSTAPQGAAAKLIAAEDGSREPRIPIVVIIGGVAEGEIELDDKRIPLDPIAHTSVLPGRYPLRWRDEQGEEWQEAGIVDVMPEDVEVGLLRVEVSPTDGARVERRP